MSLTPKQSPERSRNLRLHAKPEIRFLSQKMRDRPKGRLLVLAFHAKEDSSDLPNYTLAWNTVKNIEKKGDAWEVRLTRALPFAAAAGTKLRLHENGGTMYPAGGCITGNSWQTLKGEIKGVEKASYSNNRWAPCSKGKTAFPDESQQ